MHHPCKFGEGRTISNLDTGPAQKPLPDPDADTDAGDIA